MSEKYYPSVKNLDSYGDHGWQWTIGKTEYRTNGSGDGIWVCGTYEGNWADNYNDNQMTGILQFNLPYYSKNRKIRNKAYNRIRRFFATDYPEFDL